MTSLDIAVLVICIALVVRGVWTGFVSQIAVICGLFLGFTVAGRFQGQFYANLIPLVSSPKLAFAITFIIIFLVVYAGVVGLGIGLKKVMKVSMLSGFDRAMGGIFGLTKAIFIASLIFIALAGMLSNSGPFLRRSYSYPILASTSRYILTYIKDKNLRTRFLPKEPAISSLFKLDDDILSSPDPKLSRNKEQAIKELRRNLLSEYRQKASP